MSSPIKIGFALGESEPIETTEVAEVSLGPVITTPDQLTEPLIPYESTDRTPAGPLQMLEEATARHLGVDRRQLISREGDVTEHGSSCLFQTLPHLGAIEPDGWAIATFRADGPANYSTLAVAAAAPGARFWITTRATERAARFAYVDAKLTLALA